MNDQITAPAPNFEELGVDLAQLAAEKAARVEKKKHICKCGHPHGRHLAQGDSPESENLRASGRELCRPGRRNCNCLKYEGVVKASDPRPFLMATTGPGPRHALFQAWQKAALSDPPIEVSWLPGVGCDSCAQNGVNLVPVAFTPEWLIADTPQSVNKMLCYTCYGNLKAKQDAAAEETASVSEMPKV